MIRASRLAFAAFSAPDPAALSAYYQDVIGLAPQPAAGGTRPLASPLGETCVLLETGEAPALTRLGFQVHPDVPLADLQRRLAAGGVASELRSDPLPGIPLSLVTHDPNGLGVELFDTAVPAAAVAPSPAISPLKLGHVASYTGDIARCVSFYRDVLGFRVSDWMEDFFVFLRCGPDHHTCNFISSANRGMHHMAFELKDWAHVQTACDWLAQHGYQITWGPGRHGIGHNIFIYHRNPAGQIVELFTEMDTMSDEEAGFFDARPWHRDRPQRPKVWRAAEGSNLWGAGPPPGHRS